GGGPGGVRGDRLARHPDHPRVPELLHPDAAAVAVRGGVRAVQHRLRLRAGPGAVRDRARVHRAAAAPLGRADRGGLTGHERRIDQTATLRGSFPACAAPHRGWVTEMAVLTQHPARRRARGRTGVPEASRHVADRRRAGQRRFLSFVATHAVLLALTVMFCAPVLFVFLTAVMTDDQALTADLWPRQWVWSNFGTLFSQAPMLTWLRNTMTYALAATGLMLVSSVPVAYALARFRFRGRRFALLAVIATMMLPPQVGSVPLYVLWARWHLTGTLWPLIIPLLFGDAFSIFLLRQFLVSLPSEYADAARVDGCGELGVLLRVVLPMMRPALAAVALFQFFYSWNGYYGPLLYVGEVPEHWTLSVGLASFRGVHHVQWNLTMAATLLVMAPVNVAFLLAQRVFVEGVTLTGVKG